MHANHYHGRHAELYCGRLRSATGVCSAFQTLQECDTVVNQQLARALGLVVQFVSRHDDVEHIDLPVRDGLQPELRRHFGLTALPPPLPPPDAQTQPLTK